jgi:hypothetical protein
MIKTLKLNFTIPEDIARDLRARVSKRKRSAFVAEAVRNRLEDLETERLQQELIEGYQARKDEDSGTNREWESSTLENWQ